MIDTDKYEGHTEWPWRTAEGQPYDDEGSHLDIEGANGVLVTETSYFTDDDHPNTQLIADAPLLLEEVKRLSALADALWDLIEYFDRTLWSKNWRLPTSDVADRLRRIVLLKDVCILNKSIQIMF